jgi:hypothetical protein
LHSCLAFRELAKPAIDATRLPTATTTFPIRPRRRAADERDELAARPHSITSFIVETASRFARDLMVQEVGHPSCVNEASTLSLPTIRLSFIDATPTAKLVRQVLGAISEFDKAMTVAPLSWVFQFPPRLDYESDSGMRARRQKALMAFWCET